MRFAWLLTGLALLTLPSLIWADPPTQEKDKDVGKSFAVPCRLTDSGHILVRIKINGKGPYNFIVDTGAPLVYISVPVAKKVGIKAEKMGQTTIDKIEIEGGPLHTQFKCLIETPFQLEGMNALGLPGVELHGIIGYTLLAHYKLEFDPTKDRMTWTKLDFKPLPPQPAGGKDKTVSGLDALGSAMKLLAPLLGIKGAPEPSVRGFLGMELGENDKGVLVQSVLADGPAAKAGVKKADRLIVINGKTVVKRAEVVEKLAKAAAGQSVIVTILREDVPREITITLGEGL